MDIKGWPQRIAEVARLYAIAEHGGIWVDASLLFTQSLDWVLELQREQDLEFVGYYLEADTTLPTYPVIEVSEWSAKRTTGEGAMRLWGIYLSTAFSALSVFCSVTLTFTSRYFWYIVNVA
jgi:hypothetical protein